MVNAVRNRANLLIAIDDHVRWIRLDSYFVGNLIVLAKIETSPRQIPEPKYFANVRKIIADVHPDDDKVMFVVFFEERPPIGVEAFASTSPVTEKVQQDDFAIEIGNRDRLTVQVRASDGWECRSNRKFAVERNLLRLTAS